MKATAQQQIRIGSIVTVLFVILVVTIVVGAVGGPWQLILVGAMQGIAIHGLRVGFTRFFR